MFLAGLTTSLAGAFDPFHSHLLVISPSSLHPQSLTAVAVILPAPLISPFRPSAIGVDSQVFSKELQQRLVTPFILALNPRILQIRSSSHPSMNLITKDLDVFLALQVGLKFLNVFG